MRVFISSVRAGLEQERDYLADLIRAVGHEPSRFEDFGAVNAPSRRACLDGVRQADAYLLLLGPYYGADMIDSGVSATEEEFTVAQQRGMPILVFKKSGVEHDEAQAAFMAKLGDYQEGRFWASFTDAKSLGIQVVTALRNLEVPEPPLVFAPLVQPVDVRWRSQRTSLPQNAFSSPVLEAHVLAVQPTGLRPVSSLKAVAEKLAIRGREVAFFGQGDALDIGFDDSSAWAVRSGAQNGYGNRYHQRLRSSTDPYSGLAVGRDGSAMIFYCLPVDMLGALVNQEELSQRLTELYRILTPFLPATEFISLAAAIEPLDRVAEGHPGDVGNRSGGAMPIASGASAQAAPADQVPRASLSGATPDVAAEVAIRLMQSIQTKVARSW